MTKKGHQKFFAFFPQKSHSEILGPAKKIFVPQTRRQVSATVAVYNTITILHRPQC